MQLLDDYIDAYISTLKYLNEVVSEPAAEYGLSFEQYLIMHAIAESYDDITLTDIVEKRKVTRAAISRQIKMLMKKEYVYQETDCHDRRRQILRLTNEGKEVCEVVTNRVTNRWLSWEQAFGADRLQSFLDFVHDFEKVVVSKTRAQSHTIN